MTAAPSVSLRSVNVALPTFLCVRHGQDVASGFRKHPVTAATVHVSSTNIDGDGQGDLVAHGGPEKAVYSYPSEHWAPWTAELKPDRPYGPASFGENLSLAGILEDEACIGDIWRWGEVRLQICQPRFPCYKLGEALSDRTVVQKLVENGRTGWYFRVLTTGMAPTSGQMEIESRDPAGITVAMAHQARLPHADPALVEQVLAVDALASKLRLTLEERLATHGVAERG